MNESTCNILALCFLCILNGHDMDLCCELYGLSRISNQCSCNNNSSLFDTAPLLLHSSKHFQLHNQPNWEFVTLRKLYTGSDLLPSRNGPHNIKSNWNIFVFVSVDRTVTYAVCNYL